MIRNQLSAWPDFSSTCSPQAYGVGLGCAKRNNCPRKRSRRPLRANDARIATPAICLTFKLCQPPAVSRSPFVNPMPPDCGDFAESEERREPARALPVGLARRVTNQSGMEPHVFFACRVCCNAAQHGSLCVCLSPRCRSARRRSGRLFVHGRADHLRRLCACPGAGAKLARFGRLPSRAGTLWSLGAPLPLGCSLDAGQPRPRLAAIRLGPLGLQQ